MENMGMPRATALLLAVYAQLQRQWEIVSDVASLHTELLRVGVGASPSAVFRVAASEPVEVRGLAIGERLFVHFVGRETALRLDLILAEYTKEDSTGKATVEPRTQARLGAWIVSTEMLQWRLERNVFPAFQGTKQPEQIMASAGAELGRLPEPLLLRIAPFLSGKEYCGMTQTNKFLHEYADKDEIWEGYLANDFPHTTNSEPATKALYVKLFERDKRRVAAIRSVWDTLPAPPSRRLIPIVDPFMRPPPLFGPTPEDIHGRRPDSLRPPFFDEMY